MATDHGPFLSIGQRGASLALSAAAHPVPGGGVPYFDVLIVVDATPFSGQISALLDRGDLERFRDELQAAGPSDEVVLGGGRAVELRLSTTEQVGGDAGSLAVEVSLTPSGDDPYPYLRWLIFNQSPFALDAANHIGELLRAR